MELKIVSCEGVVYKKDDSYLIADTLKGDTDISSLITPLVSFSRVEFLGQHFPELPLQMERWGGGCCMWESIGNCPTKHHERPGYLFEFKETGKLEEKDGGWVINGRHIPLELFNGHRCRIIVVPVLNVEDLKGSDPQLSDLEATLSRLQNLQDTIRTAKENAK